MRAGVIRSRRCRARPAGRRGSSSPNTTCRASRSSRSVAVLLDSANASVTETTSRAVQEAARVIGLQIQMLNASTNREIDAAFATLARERPDALFVTADGFFTSRRVQLATLAATNRIPAAYGTREIVAAGGLALSGGAGGLDIGALAGQFVGAAPPAQSSPRSSVPSSTA